MSRCDKNSLMNSSLMAHFKRMSVEVDETKKHAYCNKAVIVRVVDICRRFLFPVLTRDSPELERLYRPYIVDGTLYLNFLTVCDNQSQLMNILLSPRYNRDMDQHKVKCGDVIKLKQYSCRILPGIEMFFEICSFELCTADEVYGEWDSWKYDLNLTKEVAEAIATFQSPFLCAAPFHLWHESIPLCPAPVTSSQEIPDAVTSAELLARFCNRAEIAFINENWKSVKILCPPLVCRIRARGNQELYKADCQGKVIRMKINLNVYDRTGGCSVVIWDQAISEEQAVQLREGVVIMLHNYTVQLDLSNNKFKVDFGDLRRFPIELHVQDERNFNKKGLEIISPEFLSHAECSRHLPIVTQPCNTFPDILARRSTRFDAGLQIDEVFPVAGIVVGMSRYYRLRRELVVRGHLPIGRFYTSRWVEIYDPKSELFLNVEVFINKQVGGYEALEIGDVAAFTFVRLNQRKASNITEDLTYVTSTQSTELFVMKKSTPLDELHAEIPIVIRKEMRRIKMHAGDQRTLEPLFWLGGAHQFVNTYYTNQAIHKLCSIDEKIFDDISQFLKHLAFWESKDLMFSGEIVLVEFCTPGPTSCKELNERNGKIQQTSAVIAKADFWDKMKETIPIYGSTCPHYLTLPMRFVEKDRSLLHNAVQFPKMNIYDRELERALDGDSDSDEQDEKYFEVYARGYYRIIILRHDKKVAISSFFLPIISEIPPTLIQALHLSHVPFRKPLESINRNMELSDLNISECAKTASFVLNKDMFGILQARCMGFNDYEILFCQLYFKNSEDERQYY